jgi:polyhydroxybutyrate depolymerase
VVSLPRIVRAGAVCVGFALAAALTLGLAACESAGRPGRPASLCSPGDRMLRSVTDGDTHQALLHIPRGARGPLPLVMAFHGAGKGARFVSKYYGLSRLGDRKGFAVLYPQASHNTFWELTPSQHEDLDAVRTLLNRVAQTACFDMRRVYATGASNGGGFSARLGCEMADRLAAIAPVAGGYSALGPCRPQRALPVLEIHGTRDQVVPYGGRGPDRDGSVEGFLNQWATLDLCRGDAERRRLRRGITRVAWWHCAGGSVVEHLRLAGTDHGWPGGDNAAVGRKKHPLPRHDPTGLSAASAVWEFFSHFRLPSSSGHP